MKFRKKLNKKYDKKSFSKSADAFHPKNSLSTARPMRGGIRL